MAGRTVGTDHHTGCRGTARSATRDATKRGGQVSLDMEQGAERTLDDLVQVGHRVGQAIESVIEGKAGAVRLALTVLLAEGHVLIEDVPGVGKTMLAKALGPSTDCSVQRIQVTPDLLPSGISRVRAYPQERTDFALNPRPIFPNTTPSHDLNTP